MYERLKQQMIDAALEMLKYRLISLSGGNVSVRTEDGTFLVTPSAIRYERMRSEDIVLVDSDGAILEGDKNPSSDMLALLYIFEHKPEINALIHTHQPYATAAGLIADRLPACLTTIIDTVHTHVPVAPFTISSDIGMGRAAVEYCGRANAVILSNHGVVGFGRDLDEALETVVYLEEGAKTYMAAKAAKRKIKLLTDVQIRSEDADRGNYGQ